MATNPTLPVVAPGELITADHMNKVRSNIDRLDVDKFNKTGGTITGTFAVTGSATFQSNTFRVIRPGSPRPFIEFWNDGQTQRQASVVGGDAQYGLELSADLGPVRVMPAPATEVARFDATNFLLGKTVSNFQSAGVEVGHGSGGVRSTMNTASVNYYANHIGAADVTSCAYAHFTRGATVIGSITQASTTAVAFNTTSDKRLKRLTRPVDPGEALAKVAAMDPVGYVWSSAPGDGEHLGFFAQDLVAVAPEAVTVGQGEPGDEPGDDGAGGFVPWMVDLSKLVPTLVAAVQALTARIEQLEVAT